MPASPVWYLNLPTLTDGASPPDPPEWYLNLPDPNPKPGGTQAPRTPVRYRNLPHLNPSLIIYRLSQITANTFFKIRPRLT